MLLCSRRAVAARIVTVATGVWIAPLSVVPAPAQVTVTAYAGATVGLSGSGAWTLTTANPAWTLGGDIQTPVTAIVAASGTDRIGKFEEIDFTAAPGVPRAGFIRAYVNVPALLFSVTLTANAWNSAPFTSVSVPANLFHISYSGIFAGPHFGQTGSDSPQIYFDSSARTFIVSPAANYMVAAMNTGPAGDLESGINSAIPMLPAGYAHSTALVYGNGIDSTIRVWGRMLTSLSGKNLPANDADPILRQVSYWTDNTATYYYNPGGPSYTGTLEAIQAEFASKGVTLGSMQLDSWWYPKGPDDNWSSHGGIWTYTAAPALFPDGLAAFQQTLRIPLTTHSRWIDGASPYRSQYAISGNVATDPAYWDMVGSYLAASGVATFEQDWLGLGAQTAVNLTDPFAFMNNMAAAMASRGITMQYCMAEPKHLLQSTLYDNATTARASQDGFTSARWTEFLYAGRFATAVGLWPFTDVFRSTDTNGMILALLSAGPVGVGDALGSLSRANLLKAARPDGVIVKPDAPAAPLDSVYIADAQGIDVPMVASAFTDYGGIRAHFIFAYTRQANNAITINPADFGIAGDSYLYDYFSSSGALIAAGASWTGALANGAGYYVLAPVGKTGIAFLGDNGQFVTLGRKRITDVTDPGRLNVTVAFAPGEKNRTLFGYSPQPVMATALSGSVAAATWDPTTQLFTLKVRPNAAGMAKVRIVKSFFGAGETGSAGNCGIRCFGPPSQLK